MHDFGEGKEGRRNNEIIEKPKIKKDSPVGAFSSSEQALLSIHCHANNIFMGGEFCEQKVITRGAPTDSSINACAH